MTGRHLDAHPSNGIIFTYVITPHEKYSFSVWQNR